VTATLRALRGSAVPDGLLLMQEIGGKMMPDIRTNEIPTNDLTPKQIQIESKRVGIGDFGGEYLKAIKAKKPTFGQINKLRKALVWNRRDI